MARKYLNDIGIDDTLMNLDSTDERWEKWQEEIEEYGFAEYETWNMDSAFYAWLYERLKMYLETASNIIDLNYHKFEFDGKTYTQAELIDKMIHGCEIALSDEYDKFTATKEENKAVEDVRWIWGTVMTAMWW